MTRLRQAILVRPMTRADLPAVLIIEQDSFPHPWNEQQFLEEMEREVSRLYVAVRPQHGQEEVVGYLSSWWVAGELHILNVAVAPQARRHGVAVRLIQEVTAQAAQQGSCRQAFLEVRRSNDAAQMLYLKLGFAAVGVRPGYYEQKREDAILMTADLDDTGGMHPPP